MGRKSSVLMATIVAVVLLSGGAFASSYIVTSIHQIKPSVVNKLRGHAVERLGVTATLCPSGAGTCDVGGSDARCPGSGVVLSGGWDGGSAPPVDDTVGYNEPDSDGHGWHVIMANDGTISSTFAAVAECSSTSGATIARAGVPSTVQTQISREVAAMRKR